MKIDLSSYTGVFLQNSTILRTNKAKQKSLNKCFAYLEYSCEIMQHCNSKTAENRFDIINNKKSNGQCQTKTGLSKTPKFIPFVS